MISMRLEYFTKDTDFPFFIQLGEHPDDLFIHSHFDFSELVVVLNGMATHIVNSDQYIIKKGDVFVFNQNTSHGFSHTHDLKICNIMYKPKHLYQIGYDLKSSPGYQALFVIEPFYRKENTFKSMLQLTMPGFEYVMNLITAMLKEYEGKHQGYQTMIYSRFLELVVYLSREYAIYSKERSEKLFHIARTISYIEEHYLENIKLKELADMSCISIRQFLRVFKENYRMTPMNYIIRLRLQHACSLLKNSTYSISEIAYESGFSDSNYFTRQFRKMLGITPKEFKKTLSG